MGNNESFQKDVGVCALTHTLNLDGSRGAYGDIEVIKCIATKTIERTISGVSSGDECSSIEQHSNKHDPGSIPRDNLNISPNIQLNGVYQKEGSRLVYINKVTGEELLTGQIEHGLRVYNYANGRLMKITDRLGNEVGQNLNTRDRKRNR